MFPERLETDRLVLERLSRETVDLRELYRICSSDDGIEEVTEQLPWNPHSTIEETADFVDGFAEQWSDGERMTYVVRPNADEPGAGEIAGMAGMYFDWARSTGTLVVWLRKRFWGRGYAGERATALVEVAFDRLDLDLVAAEMEVGNERSKRAVERYVERFGGGYDGLLRNGAATDDGPVDLRRYTITREQYRTATDSRS